MPSGKIHDFINVSMLPVFLVALRPEGLFSFIAGYIFGTFWLSPDLDLPQSKPFKRWGPLSIIWIPYAKIFKHRSIFTHLPVLGLAIRLGYLLAIIFSLYYFSLAVLTVIDEIFDTHLAPLVYNFVKKEILEGSSIFHADDFLKGLFIADTLHLVLDYTLTYYNKLRKLLPFKIFSAKKN
jgi:uncharacterized metal-binding protein